MTSTVSWIARAQRYFCMIRGQQLPMVQVQSLFLVFWQRITPAFEVVKGIMKTVFCDSCPYRFTGQFVRPIGRAFCFTCYAYCGKSGLHILATNQVCAQLQYPLLTYPGNEQAEEHARDNEMRGTVPKRPQRDASRLCARPLESKPGWLGCPATRA